MVDNAKPLASQVAAEDTADVESRRPKSLIIAGLATIVLGFVAQMAFTQNASDLIGQSILSPLLSLALANLPVALGGGLIIAGLNWLKAA